MKKRAAGVLLLLLFACASPEKNRPLPTAPGPIPGGGMQSQAAQQDFPTWLAAFEAEAMSKGISRPVLDEAFAGVIPSQEVLNHDHTQPEKTKSFADYLKGVLTVKKIAKAKEMYASHAELLARIEAAYGVPAPTLLALWGVESSFGHVQGHYSIIGSLTTLAYDGRRSAFFRTQLIDALLIVQNEHIPPATLTGSWAGAMGQTQFMPSSFLSYAVDFDGDGIKDIWGSDADALASIANYLHSKGWNPSGLWGIQVRLPQNAANVAALVNQERTIRDWTALGITRAGGGTLPNGETSARLVLPDGDPAYAYLTFANYKVIMDWNHSTYFATSVGLLADAIARP